MRLESTIASALGAAAVMLFSAPAAQAVPLRITLTNTSPIGGVGLSPLWVGLHDGSFDVFSPGAGVSSGLERVAEDGDTAAITALFTASTPIGVQGTLPGAPAFPGNVRSLTVNADPTGAGRYFSYASMVVVSNDFFVANGSPTAIDLSGLKAGQTLSILIGRPFEAGRPNVVYDAGSEVNDFLFSLANGAFGIPGGQTGANQGTTENGVAAAVQGNPFANFLNAPPGSTPSNLDFNDPALYTSVGRIDIFNVPEPASVALLAGALGLAGIIRRRARA